MGEVTYSSDSCVINPNGEVLTEVFGKENILEYKLFDDVEKIEILFE